MLVNALSEADRLLGELAGLGRTMPNPQLLIRPFVRREAVLSSRIEGTQADVEDVYAFEAGQLGLPGFKPITADVQEVVNYVQALEYGISWLNDASVSLYLIRQLHQLLLQGVRGEQLLPGEFRDRQNWIGERTKQFRDARYVPPPTLKMQGALQALEAYIRDDHAYPPIVRIALVHYQFEAIHPFLDGNGRIGRLLVSLLLVHWGLLPLPLLYLSAFFERHRNEYYDLLLAVSERGAWNEWLSFFLRGVAEQAQDATRRAKQLQDLQKAWEQRLTQAQASTRLLALVNKLFEVPIISIPQARQMMDVTYRSARNNVEKLLELNILRQLGDASYSRVFIAEDILQIIAATQAPKGD